MRSPLTSPDISGLIPVNKPVGMTSKDVSRVLIKRFGKIKIGHVGTLDPDADGVLPILIGRGTKLQDYLLNMEKAYSFELTLGQFTDTMDASGSPIEERPWSHVTEDKIAGIIGKFTGPLQQIPPVYSAVKFKGKELYKYARAGKTAEDLPIEELQRSVTIYELKLNYFEAPRIGLTVRCSKGTYVRTLATDMAKELNTAGHVTRLTRTSSAGFTLDSCVSLEQIEDKNATLETLIIPINQLSIGLPTWVSDDMVTLQRVVDGQHLVIDGGHFHDSVGPIQSRDALAKSSDGRSIGIIEVTPLEGGRVKLHMKRGL
jgi:tRNA pseudouridine55 synthase